MGRGEVRVLQLEHMLWKDTHSNDVINTAISSADFQRPRGIFLQWEGEERGRGGE